MSLGVRFKVFLYYISFLAADNDNLDENGDDAEDEVIKSLKFCCNKLYPPPHTHRRTDTRIIKY